MKLSAVLERVLKIISRYNMLAPGVRVAVAVSGGADSVCLLHVLRELGASLTGVAHFNHKLRDAASDEDEDFVGKMAARLGLPFYRGDSQVRAVRDNLEQAARLARRRFFDGLIGDGAAERIALGHTRDDQAETVLFRILRGSGLTGLAGIHPVSGAIIRPLINITREEVEEFLRSRDIPWREDSTNGDLKFARNRIRHQLLPQLKREWNPKIVEALAHLADIAYEEEPLPDGRGSEIQTTDLLPRGRARRLIRQAIAQAKGDLRGIGFAHIESIIELAVSNHGRGRLSLPGVEVTRSFDWIRLALPGRPAIAAPLIIDVPGTYPTPDGGGSIRLEVEETTCANLKSELAWGRIPTRLELRGWRPGDHYHPVGQSRDQKIKEMFQTNRIPSWRRPSWPIVTAGDKILWAREFGPAAEFAVSDDSGPVLRISES
jgi:tRNA(Ile)-lysidine synthase